MLPSELPDPAFFDDVPIGYVEESPAFTVDRAEMIAYAKKNDPWPIHVDEAAARETVFGDVIASFGYTVSLVFRMLHTLRVNQVVQEAFLGAVEWRVLFQHAVRAEDQLRLRATVTSTRRTSSGDRGVCVTRAEILNQSDTAVIVIEVTTLIRTR